MSKVFHVDDDVHQLAKEFCEQRDLPTKQWIGRLTRWAVENRIVDPSKGAPVGSPKMVPESRLQDAEMEISRLKNALANAQAKKEDLAPVKKKPMPLMDESVPKDDPFTAPPFWERKEEKRGEAQSTQEAGVARPGALPSHGIRPETLASGQAGGQRAGREDARSDGRTLEQPRHLGSENADAPIRPGSGEVNQMIMQSGASLNK